VQRRRSGTCPCGLPSNSGAAALSAVGLLICATAAQRDLIVLHDDNGLTTAARYLPDLRERAIRNVPPTD
jgi:hypothetical protein